MPLANAVCSLLEGLVLPHAPRDSAQELREAILSNDGVREALRARGALLRALWAEAEKAPLPPEQQHVAVQAARGQRPARRALALSRAAAGEKAPPPDAATHGVTAAALVALLDARGALYVPPIKTRVRHLSRGAGTVTELMPDGRTRVAFDSGEEHRYAPPPARPPRAAPSPHHRNTRARTTRPPRARV